MQNYHDIRFPGESDAYRDSRNALLEAEIDLRRQMEAVAALRRSLPRGGKLKEDYIFDEMTEGGPIRTNFSSLFQPGKPSLIIYSMMYAPDDEKACPSCTSILDALDGSSQHVNDVTTFIVSTRAPIEKASAWADYRDWRNLRLLSSYNNSYNADYFAEANRDQQWPLLNVFEKTPDAIYHRYSTELFYAKPDPGQDMRHVDLIWPVWQLLDYTPEGRGKDWRPKYEYDRNP